MAQINSIVAAAVIGLPNSRPSPSRAHFGNPLVVMVNERERHIRNIWGNRIAAADIFGREPDFGLLLGDALQRVKQLPNADEYQKMAERYAVRGDAKAALSCMRMKGVNGPKAASDEKDISPEEFNAAARLFEKLAFAICAKSAEAIQEVLSKAGGKHESPKGPMMLAHSSELLQDGIAYYLIACYCFIEADQRTKPREMMTCAAANLTTLSKAAHVGTIAAMLRDLHPAVNNPDMYFLCNDEMIAMPIVRAVGWLCGKEKRPSANHDAKRIEPTIPFNVPDSF